MMQNKKLLIDEIGIMPQLNSYVWEPREEWLYRKAFNSLRWQCPAHIPTDEEVRARMKLYESNQTI